jgi:putative membrane protein
MPDDRAAQSGESPSSDDDHPGMDPRLHYANERTFLAWIRTALALMTAGLVVTQLLPAFKLSGGRRIVGVPLIALGAFLAAAAFRQWDVNEKAMRAGREIPPSRLPLVTALGVGIIALIAVVLATTHSVGS